MSTVQITFFLLFFLFCIPQTQMNNNLFWWLSPTYLYRLICSLFQHWRRTGYVNCFDRTLSNHYIKPFWLIGVIWVVFFCHLELRHYSYCIFPKLYHQSKPWDCFWTISTIALENSPMHLGGLYYIFDLFYWYHRLACKVYVFVPTHWSAVFNNNNTITQPP